MGVTTVEVALPESTGLVRTRRELAVWRERLADGAKERAVGAAMAAAMARERNNMMTMLLFIIF